MPKVELEVNLGKIQSASSDYEGSPVFIVKCLIDASPLDSVDLTIEGMLSNLTQIFIKIILYGLDLV